MKRGRPAIYGQPMTSAERNRRRMNKLRAASEAAKWQQEMIDANPEWSEVHHALLVRRGNQWYLIVGRYQSDGVLRHVDVNFEKRIAEPMLTNLSMADPLEIAKQGAMIEKISRGGALDA